MKKDSELLNIFEDGCKINLYTKSGTLIADKYERVVIGQRGPYVEFTKTQLNQQNLYIPRSQLFRLSDPKVYYIEFRTNDESNVMVYYQMRTVAYADYAINNFYISPSDLFLSDGTPCISEKVTINTHTSEFFQFS